MEKEQLLYRYFSNDLAPEQEKKFNELLATDLEFKEQFDFEKDLQKVIRNKNAKVLKSKLVGFERDISQDIPVRTLPRRKFQNWAIAASVALLVGLGWFGYNNFLVTDYEDLYNDNFQEYPNTVYAITRGDTVESLERKAFAAYEFGDFEAALADFNKIPDADKQPYLNFYKAQSYLQLGKLAEAKALFEKTISEDTQFAAESHWYLALAYLKEKDKVNAIVHLKQLISEYDYNTEKATALLEELE